MLNLSELAQKLKKEKSVAVICHLRPDGDAIGSAAALVIALNGLGVTAKAFCEDKIPAKFGFLPCVNQFSTELVGEYTALVAVDCADITRLGGFAEAFERHKNTYNIDHHVSNNRFAKLNYVCDTAANSENVIELCHEAGIAINKDMANLLLTGLMTDTGGFRHKNVTPKTLSFASEMVELGGDINYIYYKTFAEQSKARAKLYGKVMANLRYFREDRIAVASVMLSDFKETGALPEETEGFIDFVMGIAGVEIGACVMQIDRNKFKISFRSKGADVNSVAATFGGGGHTLASGCQIFGEYEEVIDKITFAMYQHLS